MVVGVKLAVFLASVCGLGGDRGFPDAAGLAEGSGCPCTISKTSTTHAALLGSE